MKVRPTFKFFRQQSFALISKTQFVELRAEAFHCGTSANGLDPEGVHSSVGIFADNHAHIVPMKRLF
ncbi:hypothetical protein [Rhizobium sp. CCGE532]|uniref:hypothetical protein n=1 Tax=Rhizobium sp. CCGE532 TaxID=2364272 RepID=UPI0013C4AA10|nr:hypothetical protein [Rhizobium sp. CCGE532]